jgi:diguanylate cyclase
LKALAKRLLHHTRDEDSVCRNGGDEFLYLMMDPQGSENIERIAEALLEAIGQPVDLGDLQPVINASLGIAIYPDDGTSEEELIKNADTAMYRAKKAGVGCIFFNPPETEGASAGESVPRAAFSC